MKPDADLGGAQLQLVTLRCHQGSRAHPDDITTRAASGLTVHRLATPTKGDLGVALPC
jgi:hypothetical protein